MNILGVEVDDIPDDFSITEVIVFAKGIDTEGVISIYKRSSDGLTVWEELGILTGGVSVLTGELNNSWEDQDDA